ncbi:hypothetical protein [Amycolatopsis alba]|uniref:hypothetical protein n=1 Tax=Amycolatopsis alba TaxID=76020 RepID=UPI000370004B|nr:hypothetical protein [Amycolatopsis alba]
MPSKLMALHPRKRGNPGNAGALAPAISLGVISAFEGFTEDFLATALYLQGQSFGQIAQKVNINNPDIDTAETLVVNNFHHLKAAIGVGVSVDIRKIPTHPGKQGWTQHNLNWVTLKQEAAGWMQVRHCLTHGLVTGAGTEVWPGPVKQGKPPASTVLRPKANGQHSLNLYGAISCARVYFTGAQHLADLVATTLNQQLDWRGCPEFPLIANPA